MIAVPSIPTPNMKAYSALIVRHVHIPSRSPPEACAAQSQSPVAAIASHRRQLALLPPHRPSLAGSAHDEQPNTPQQSRSGVHEMMTAPPQRPANHRFSWALTYRCGDYLNWMECRWRRRDAPGMRSYRRNRFDALQPRDEPTWLTVF